MVAILDVSCLCRRPRRCRAPAATERDLRLDLFRGIALWLIFLDHIPENVVNWFTIRNYGFSTPPRFSSSSPATPRPSSTAGRCASAADLIASARILRRAWQIYVAHIFLFTIFMAEIAYVAATFDNPLYAEEMDILDFLKQPTSRSSCAAAEVQPGQHGRAAALHRAVAAVSADPRLLMWQPVFALSASALFYVPTWNLI